MDQHVTILLIAMAKQCRLIPTGVRKEYQAPRSRERKERLRSLYNAHQDGYLANL